ncbi:hypothetical protein RJ640_001765 [Escallonia rubra]|uniref:Reverse transcriptase Ty1/copia-type domain-containing protein n=1 Tax=Escallonia rubra TaxID=112253 RepID=A0AA88S5J2_9ASTE|nr:hypothetical protein RJ640_001765 [Escallonia rubra]
MNRGLESEDPFSSHLLDMLRSFAKGSGGRLETKGYKLYNPKAKMVIINWDVTFDEDGVWDWSKEEQRLLPVPIFINNEVETINQIDDLIFTGNNSKFLSKFGEDMIAQFEMTDIGLMPYFLRIEVKQTNKGIFISQKKYAGDIVKKFKMDACNPILIPIEERSLFLAPPAGFPGGGVEFSKGLSWGILVASVRWTASSSQRLALDQVVSPWFSAPKFGLNQVCQRKSNSSSSPLEENNEEGIVLIPSSSSFNFDSK